MCWSHTPSSRRANPATVSSLWERVKDSPEVPGFERFVLALDLLYIMGAITLEDGLIRRTKP